MFRLQELRTLKRHVLKRGKQSTRVSSLSMDLQVNTGNILLAISVIN